ncbi:MAG: methanogenesis marker 17 protein, partial [Candidatus Methanospirareceae archaeon]
MHINISSTDKRAAEAYKRIIEIFQSYFPVNIRNIQLNIEIERGVFMCYIEYGRGEEEAKIGNIADIEEVRREEEVYTRFRIREEKYAPSLLSYLWRRFGRDKVEQKSRLEVILKEKIKREDIESVGLEKREEYSEGLWAFLKHIIPEGFRIWYKRRSGNAMLIIASENEIK